MNKNVFFIIFLILTFFIVKIFNGQECFEVERFVSGVYFDTFSLCSDANGNIFIDLQDVNGDGSDLFYIPQQNGDWSKPIGNQKTNSGNWKNFYREVTIYPAEPIQCRNFELNCRDNYQSLAFTFNLSDEMIECEKLSVLNPNYRDYFILECESVLKAKEIVFSYKGQPLVIKGTIVSEKVSITDGNSTSTRFGDCCLLKTDTLVVNQSKQNSIKVDGHIIAEVVQSTADILLEYNESTITVGELPSNVKIIGNDNTTVNLCKNPTSSADNLGYFTGTIMYAKSEWNDFDPAQEGDVNYNNNSSDYWVWKNKNKNPELIAAYTSSESCMMELIDLYLFINEEKSKKSTYLKTNTLLEKNKAIFYDYTGRKIGNRPLILPKSSILWDGQSQY